MSIEKKFDIPFISDLALREKQIQQNYRPIIAVHKWFARRPGTLFRGLILSEFSEKPLREAFYSSNDLKGIAIADPFMGGGTPLIEANRVGCDVTGYDINPMAYWIVSREIEHLDLGKYRKSAENLTRGLETQIGAFYRTQCLECGSPEAHVKYFLWVKKQPCRHCGHAFDLFPGYLLAENRRHTENVFICASCGDLNGVEDRTNPGICKSCGGKISLTGPAKRNNCACPRCGKVNTYPNPAAGPPSHRNTEQGNGFTYGGNMTEKISNMVGMVAYQDGSIVSKEIMKKPTGTTTIFAFDRDQGLSEHTAPFDALVYILDGEAEIIIAGEPHQLKTGEMIIMPGGKPHALKALKRFKMMLVMIRS